MTTVSYNTGGFYEMQYYPAVSSNMDCVRTGLCSLNPNGKPIYGGTLQAGTSGYGLSQFRLAGNNSATCAAFPLWASGNQPYEIGGWMVRRNRIPVSMGPGV